MCSARRCRRHHLHTSSVSCVALGMVYVGLASVPAASLTSRVFDATRTQVFTQDDLGLPFEVAENFDEFGRALATGDFDCDGYDDLAVGVPLEELTQGTRAGVVHVLFGSALGLSTTGNRFLSEDQLQGGSASASAQFGKVLTSGDFDGDTCDELVVGVPEADLSGLADAGAVWVIPGGPGGPEASLARRFTQAEGITGMVEALDHFGSSLAVGNLNGDAFDDLVIGAFGEVLDSGPNEGAVWLLPGSSEGLLDEDEDPSFWRQLVYQDLAMVLHEEGEANDQFGWSLALCDFDGDGLDDLAVGVPGEDAIPPRSTMQEAGLPLLNEGAIHYLFGSALGVSTSRQAISRGALSELRLGYTMTFARVGEGQGRGNEGGGSCLGLAGVPLYDTDALADSGGLILQAEVSPGQPVDSFGVTQATLLETVESGDQFGWAVAAGDFSGESGAEEWVTTAPREDVEASIGLDHGLLHVVFQNLGQIEWSHQGELTRPATGPDPASRFGEALAVGDFDGDGKDDLAVGAPGANFIGSARGALPHLTRAGKVHVHYSSHLLFADSFESGSTGSWSGSS